MTSPLNPGQQVLNQRFLSERCMDEESLRKVYKGIEQHFDTEDLSLQDAIASSNQQLHHLGLEIVAVEMDSTRYYALVNKTTTDPVCKSILHTMAFNGSAAAAGGEQALVTAMLALLVQEETASRNDLVNTRNELKENRISLLESQAVLDRLIQQKWIVTKTKNRCELGPRSMCELSHFLTDQLGMDTDRVPQRIFL